MYFASPDKGTGFSIPALVVLRLLAISSHRVFSFFHFSSINKSSALRKHRPIWFSLVKMESNMKFHRSGVCTSGHLLNTIPLVTSIDFIFMHFKCNIVRHSHPSCSDCSFVESCYYMLYIYMFYIYMLYIYMLYMLSRRIVRIEELIYFC